MRSWVYYIQLRAFYKDGRVEEEGLLYVVALPDEEKLKSVDMECYATEYLPQDLALRVAQAYAVGTHLEVKDLSLYGLEFYREEQDLYIFREGISFEEGLVNSYRLLLEELKKRGDIEAVEPVVDVGTPSFEVMYKCLNEAVSSA